MPKVKVELPESVVKQLQGMVEEGYFESIEEAVRACITVVLALTA